VRLLLGVILIVEAAFAGLYTLQLIPALAGYDAIAVGLILARAGVGALQLTGGWQLVQKAPSGPALARLALLLSAVLTTMIVGWRLAPSEIYYWIRWEVVTGYWAYAVVGAWSLTRSRGEKNREVRADKNHEVRADKNHEVRGEENHEVRADKNHEVRGEENREVREEKD
jgi:hypothetical protein